MMNFAMEQHLRLSNRECDRVILISTYLFAGRVKMRIAPFFGEMTALTCNRSPLEHPSKLISTSTPVPVTMMFKRVMVRTYLKKNGPEQGEQQVE